MATMIEDLPNLGADPIAKPPVSRTQADLVKLSESRDGSQQASVEDKECREVPGRFARAFRLSIVLDIILALLAFAIWRLLFH